MKTTLYQPDMFISVFCVLTECIINVYVCTIYTKCNSTSHLWYPEVGLVQMERVQIWFGGGSGVKGSWAFVGGRWANGSRNRPCSTAPDSLIMVSAVNVFGVREWYPILSLSASTWSQNTAQNSPLLPLALSPLLPLSHLPAVVVVRL